ncbi:SH3 domain-containing kinase-binding protein 1 [Brachionichthys hirsutus]|uniref:SH3 domain-containing kinase-binding protein 1 n=1 Tax=Brachionichthys hirsutus TaxID=412623 RepID=UPI0036047E52
MTLMMEEEPTPSTSEDDSPETSQNGSELPKEEPAQAFSSLLPKVLSAVLPPGLGAEPEPDSNPIQHNPPNLERLQAELRELRDQFDKMKSQHNKEIKLLMSELDEEKKIRLTLQMEIERLKKRMSK